MTAGGNAYNEGRCCVTSWDQAAGLLVEGTEGTAGGHVCKRFASVPQTGQTGAAGTQKCRSTPQALVAQRIRASDYGSEGWGFESLRARQAKQQVGGRFDAHQWRCYGAVAEGIEVGPSVKGRNFYSPDRVRVTYR